MREIKFEILWVKHNFDFTKTIETHYTTLDRLTSRVDGFPYSDVEVIAKRQYTGLKDKNGVEIYEGDIVKCKGYVGNLTVSHCNFDFDEVSGFYLTEKSGSIAFNSFEGVEVIGNIHQNPELLD